jgi:hypothetical protein
MSKRGSARKKRAKAKRPANRAKQAQKSQPVSDAAPPIRVQIPRPNATTFMNIIVVPQFPAGHPLGGVELSPAGSPGHYRIEAVLGIPGASTSAFTEVDWEQITAKGDALIELPRDANGFTQSWSRGGPDGEHVISFDFGVNKARRLATAATRLEAAGFQQALVPAQDVLASYLSTLSFQYDIPIDAVAWRVTEERTGATRLAMRHLGKFRPFDEAVTYLTSPEIRELLSTWREAMNAENPMSQALGLYKIIERIHGYRGSREFRTRNIADHYQAPRELIPEDMQDLTSEYELSREAFKPFLGRKFTYVWKQELRESIRNAVAHLREDEPSLTQDRAADVEVCRQALPVLHYIARTMLRAEIFDQERWPESDGA